jgi:hypothetical protein
MIPKESSHEPHAWYLLQIYFPDEPKDLSPALSKGEGEAE